MMANQDTLNESPNESPDETEIEYDIAKIIQGAFVAANPMKRGKAQDFQWVKLSSINSIEPIYNNGDTVNFCYFKTYKDCTYLTGINSNDLRKAINNFLFNPDEHWEAYGY